MQQKTQWQPTITIQRGDQFVPNERSIFGGSLHMVHCQLAAYVPVFARYLSGDLLDTGCGQVPYYEVCKPLVDSHYCIDHDHHAADTRFIDESVDLNGPWQLGRLFDSILCSDVLAHVQNPFLLFQSMSAHLKPNGYLVVTTPFNYWMSHPPHEYFHATEEALKHLCQINGLEVMQIQSYGGYADIQLDMLNKRWSTGWRHRCFRMLRKIVINTGIYRHRNSKFAYNWSLGYILVARKIA
jgi:hypothetical protein